MMDIVDINQISLNNPILCIASAWILNSFVFSRLGGWTRLAKEYRSDGNFSETLKWFQSGKVGLISYGRCLWVGTSEEGVFLKTGPLFLFRLFHPPLMIPWSAIKSVSDKKFLWMDNLLIEFKTCNVKLVLPRKALADHTHDWSQLHACKILEPRTN